MQPVTRQQKSIVELSQLISVGEIAMMSTRTQKGELRSRPMETCFVDDSGDIYFFATIDSPLTDELTEHNQINLSYVNTRENDFISVYGVAEFTRNEQEIDRLWDPKYERWIPGGSDAPNLALLVVRPIHAEHWGRVGRLENIARLFVYGKATPNEVYETMSVN